MKRITCWDDLSPHGIVPLTGEACGLSYRVLCDVTDYGKLILEKAFGVAEMRLRESWNCGTEDNPHVGSIMLSYEFLSFIGVFALLEAGCPEVWLTQNAGLVGIERSDSEEDVEHFKMFHANNLGRRFSYSGTAGDRNVHTMSGRIH